MVEQSQNTYNQEKQASFMKAYNPCHQAFVRYCSALAYGKMNTEDLVQDILLSAYERFDKIRKKDQLLHYLIRAARYRSINNWKKAKYHTTRLEQHSEKLRAQGISPDLSLDIEWMYRALDQLPQKQKEAIILYEISGFSMKEIAQIQQDSITAVKTRISRGRKKLRKRAQGKNSFYGLWWGMPSSPPSLLHQESLVFHHLRQLSPEVGTQQIVQIIQGACANLPWLGLGIVQMPLNSALASFTSVLLISGNIFLFNPQGFLNTNQAPEVQARSSLSPQIAQWPEEAIKANVGTFQEDEKVIPAQTGDEQQEITNSFSETEENQNTPDPCPYSHFEGSFKAFKRKLTEFFIKDGYDYKAESIFLTFDDQDNVVLKEGSRLIWLDKKYQKLLKSHGINPCPYHIFRVASYPDIIKISDKAIEAIERGIRSEGNEPIRRNDLGAATALDKRYQTLRIHGNVKVVLSDVGDPNIVVKSESGVALVSTDEKGFKKKRIKNEFKQRKQAVALMVKKERLIDIYNPTSKEEEVEVFMSPIFLKRIEIDGGGTLICDKEILGENLDIQIKNNGQATLKVNAQVLNLDLQNGATLKVSGAVDTLHLKNNTHPRNLDKTGLKFRN